jgi:Na+/H+ antiporter NhaD/arsenite permease-like protein
VFVYTLLILIGSNTVSNVPLVLLLGRDIPKLYHPTGAWLLLSFVSTIAGNLVHITPITPVSSHFVRSIFIG